LHLKCDILISSFAFSNSTCTATIRGYNRLAMMSRAELVAVIQDDDLPPATPDWLLQVRLRILV
jgi:hypothetical protein